MIINVFEKESRNQYIFDNAVGFREENNTLTVWDCRGRKYQFTNYVYRVEYESEGRYETNMERIHC